MDNEMNSDLLYEEMVVLEKRAYMAQDYLLDRIKSWLTKVISKDIADYTKIILATGGYIQIRTIEQISENILENFAKEFNFKLSWEKKEEMTDYRNVEVVSATIYEYAFIPKNINKILGDNQVGIEDGSD